MQILFIIYYFVKQNAMSLYLMNTCNYYSVYYSSADRILGFHILLAGSFQYSLYF
jgi:hypothetical protein